VKVSAGLGGGERRAAPPPTTGSLEDEFCPEPVGAVGKTRGEAKRTTDMRDDQHRFLLLLGQLPARLTVEQTAWVLNCQAHDVPILVAAKLLKPLGNPPQNGVKYFASKEIMELAQDQKWLHRVTVAIYQHCHKRNTRKNDATMAEVPVPKIDRDSSKDGDSSRTHLELTMSRQDGRQK
jgi:hypothetical protein